MNIRNRVEKLEQANPLEMPSFVIQFVCPKRGQLPIERFRTMGNSEVFTREPDETEEAFIKRATATVTRPAILIPVIPEDSA